MNILAWFIFVGAAVLEVCGDAMIRRGLRGQRLGGVLAGCATLGAYGVLVNTVKWDFSRLLGVYVGFFALVSFLAGWIAFGETIPASTWLGLAVIMAGCMLIQFGPR